MIKCSKCGGELVDDAKFCKFCGASVEAESWQIVCPSCGNSLSADAWFCSNCGARLDIKEVVVCPSCGREDGPDARFCVECGAPLAEVKRVKKVVVDGDNTQKSASAAPKVKSSGAVNGLKDLRDKTVGFEQKTHIIRNAVVIALAVLFSLLAIFIPVRVVSYSFDNLNVTVGADEIFRLAMLDFDDLEDGAEIEIKCNPIPVRQSMIKLFGAFSYSGLDPEGSSKDKKKYDEISKKYKLALEEALLEAYDKCDVKSASELYRLPKRKQQAFYRAFEKSCSKHLSKINYIGYLLATDNYTIVRVGNNSKDPEYEIVSGDPGAYTSDMITLIMSIVVTAIAFGIAAVCAVWLVFAVIGLVKRKATFSPERLLFIVSLLSGIGLIVSMLAPCGAACGGMLGVLISAIVASTIMGVVNMLTGKTTWKKLVKRTALVVLSTIALLLLTTNAVSTVEYANISTSVGGGILTGSKSISVTVKVIMKSPIGVFLSETLSYVVPATLNIKPEIDVNLTGVVVSGIVAFSLTLDVLAFAFVALMRNLHVVRADNDQVKEWKVPSVIVAATSLVLIIFTGGVSPALCKAFSERAVVDSVRLELLEWFAMRAQAYFTMFISIGAFLISLLLFREKKAEAVQAAVAPQEESATAADTEGQPTVESDEGETAEESTEENNNAEI